MIGALPPSIAERVGKLVRLLGSDHDGEALGAARAIGRTLAGAGLGLEDLAAAIERPGRAIEIYLADTFGFGTGSPTAPRPSAWDTTPKPSPAPRFPGDRRPGFGSFNIFEQYQIARFILAWPALSEADRAFVESIAAKLRAAPRDAIASWDLGRITSLWRPAEAAIGSEAAA